MKNVIAYNHQNFGRIISMTKRISGGLAATILLFTLTACNLPLTHNITPTPNVTQAYQTIQAQIATLAASGTTATPSPVVLTTVTPLPQGSATIPPANTVSAPTTAPTAVCDRVLPGNPIDVSIPDDSNITAGSSFTKTWRLVNGGNCTWTQSYSIVWVAGEVMTTQNSYRLPSQVAPGTSIDISLDMTAPASVGNYQAYWMLQNSAGSSFGIGPTGKSPFWVKINVLAAQTATPTVTVSPTTAPSHNVIFTGIASLNNAQSTDITNGVVAGGENLDLAFADSTLKATNGAGLSSALSSQPNYSTCQSQSFGNSSVALSADTLYKYFCVTDNQKNIGSIQVLAFSAGTNLTVEIVTWSSN
jgi:hypothetical protein